MENVTSFLQWEDKISIELQRLYELYGYDRYRMEKFEPYDMYMENKRFINASSVITFYDADGRLMALKPDVTLSVVKNTNPDDQMKKVYYLENVFRMDGRTHEYRELKQIGLEFIGGEGFYPEAETVTMAAKSLAAISENFVLCISLSLIHILWRMTETCIMGQLTWKCRRRGGHSLNFCAGRELTRIYPAAPLSLIHISTGGLVHTQVVDVESFNICKYVVVCKLLVYAESVTQDASVCLRNENRCAVVGYYIFKFTIVVRCV